jgi:ribosomal-protein-alanine N-acetyltransferase
MIPPLRTARLQLRRWRPEDAAPFADLNADPRVMQHFPRALDRATSDALLLRIEAAHDADGFGLFAVERLEDSALLGFCGLMPVRFTPERSPGAAPLPSPLIEIGWRFARHAWGQGYAFESAAACLHQGFEALGLGQIVSFTVPANTRSWRLMERLGLRRDPLDDFDHPSIAPDSPLLRHGLWRIDRRSWAQADRPADPA